VAVAVDVMWWTIDIDRTNDDDVLMGTDDAAIYTIGLVRTIDTDCKEE
jgi:hypothetical protein